MSFISSPYRGPTEVTYLFVDGAYLTERLKTFCEYWFGGPAEFDYRALGSQFTKVFYYDCLPAQKVNESEIDYAVRLAATEAHFNTLRGYAGWHVIEGVSKRKKGGSTQKEVDILIAVDMLTHTYRKNMHKLAFIAGDQDFRPLLDAIVRDGMYVELWYEPKSISVELMHTADATRPLDLFALHQYFTQEVKLAFPLPTRSLDAGIPAGATLVEVGMRNGQKEAELWRYSNFDDHLLLVEEPDSLGRKLQYRITKEVAFMKRVHASYDGDVQWVTP